MSLQPGRLLGAYEVVGPLGAGGMGEVYRARDTRLGRTVAIKFVSEDLAADPAAAERLAREARLTSALNHPNIVTVHDIGEADGRPFIVMEFVAGQSLHERLAAGALKPRQAVDIACQVADGLAAAHGTGVVHRDLKPRNIMLTEDGRAKIVDFGLGKTAVLPAGSDDLTVRAAGLTAEHVVVGTAGYMAPEQVTGHAVDFRADQFALGAVIYEMLTGHRAFKRDTAVGTMAAIVEAEPPPIAESSPSVLPELVTVIERCLAKEPANRYASTKDLARDLHDIKTLLTAGSRSAHSIRPVPPKPARNRRMVVGLASLVVLAALVAAAVFWLPSRPDPLVEGRALLVRYDKRQNVDRAVELLAAGVAAHPKDLEMLVSLAEAYFRQWEYKKADASLLQRASDAARSAQNLDDNSAPLHVVWAMINYASGRNEAAATEAERAIALDKNSSRAWQESGLAYQALKRPKDAEQALLKAVALGPKDWRSQHFLGRLYLTTGRPADAIKAYKQAYELAPDNTRILNNYGSALFSLDQLDAAKGIWQQSLTVEPSMTAFSNYGTVLYEQTLYADAAVQFESAVKFPEATSVHWRNLADACHWVPRLQERARVANETVIKLGEAELKTKPSEDLKAGLAWTYALLERTAESRRLMAELEQQRAGSKDALYTMATTYELLRDRTRALATLARAVKAGYSLARIERSPWLTNLRQDARYRSDVLNSR